MRGKRRNRASWWWFALPNSGNQAAEDATCFLWPYRQGTIIAVSDAIWGMSALLGHGARDGARVGLPRNPSRPEARRREPSQLSQQMATDRAAHVYPLRGRHPVVWIHAFLGALGRAQPLPEGTAGPGSCPSQLPDTRKSASTILAVPSWSGCSRSSSKPGATRRSRFSSTPAAEPICFTGRSKRCPLFGGVSDSPTPTSPLCFGRSWSCRGCVFCATASRGIPTWCVGGDGRPTPMTHVWNCRIPGL